MANINRASGRQAPASQSGRTAAAAPSASGRTQASASNARMAATPSGSGRSPAASGRAPAPAPAPAPSRASGRQQVSSASRQQMAPASRSSRRAPAGGHDDGGRPVKKKIRGSKALLYIFGGLAVLGLLCMVLYFNKKNKKNEIAGILDERERTFEGNMSRAKSAFERAHNAGLLWVIGQEPGANPEDKTLDPKLREKLFGSFMNDQNIYNVILEWSYKDKKQKPKDNRQFLYPEKTKIEKIDNKGREEGGLMLTYGFAENRTLPVVVAEKRIKSKEGDNANTGGLITVIVKADKDYIFEKAMQAKAKNAPGGS